ncbi:flagellar biosynthetic protein FliS [Schinkia azotoformans MEV2011]|uniref:Flagellar secretion chaperone FliS n=2 Tax=Schinkia azotoformans TaxID=1454 RepID=K6C960_SCHAZ|nr:flagellar export chaperone FliS [Schinkia azotoformans]EKN67655.1 flagellar protein FliS [Schinkia azotoformans LMG 9581]KEF40342.1 flagellar biosynthetic protein FliS [Schinkia azotoformans MEV2011]MEC1637573.1 flagellar export chaperone FliS [Schinkia azotoformans]MEC1696350.1 flagellar export chaperone FliS [Schinkia azotoformans]MEC1715520.1 flagellar export chaperone FliS [Schinkia azotoformans]
MTGILTEEALYKKSPQEITALLYEACLTNLEESIDDINNKDYVIANKKLQKANDILQRLGAGLNYEAGIIADQLDVLYNYMADKVVEANYKKDTLLIEEVIKGMEPISIAWNEALKKKPAQTANVLKNKAMAYEKSVLMEDK